MVGNSYEEMRTIGEVAESLDLPQHVLRFWETRFKEIDPLKRAGGRRFYRPRDIELVAAIRHLLYREGYTIKGVQRILKEQGVEAVLADVNRRLNGDDPAPSPPPDPVDEAADEVPLEDEVLDVAAASEPAADAAPQEPSARHPPAAFPLEDGDAGDLRRALAEIEECKRLLNLTRR